MFFSQNSLFMGYVPGYSIGHIHDLCSGLSAKWIRKSQGYYLAGQGSK